MITVIDFFAENPIENKTLADSNIYDDIIGNGDSDWKIENSNDAKVISQAQLFLQGATAILTNTPYLEMSVSNNAQYFVKNNWYINYGLGGPGATPMNVYFGGGGSPNVNVYFMNQGTVKIGGGSTGQVLTTDGSGNLSWTTPGGGVTDGDKGDITVTGSGSTWTIDNDSVSYSKIQNVSTNNRILGRASSGAGDIEEITLGTNLSFSGTTLNASSGGLTAFTESVNTSGVNSSISANRLIPLSSTSSSDIVIQPKGTQGSILAQLPDGTATGGNKRGHQSIDLQMSRISANMVAEGNGSVLIGGSNNRTRGNNNAIINGNDNFIGNSAGNSSIYNSTFCTTDGGIYGHHIGGYSSYINGSGAIYSSILAGRDHFMSFSDSSVILGGQSNLMTSGSKYSASLGGANNTNNKFYAVISGENGKTTRSSFVQSNSPGVEQGRHQSEQITLRANTNSTSPTLLFNLGSSGVYLPIASGETISYHGLITCSTNPTTNKKAYYEIKGIVSRTPTTSSLLWSNLVTNYTDDATWTITQTVNTLNNEIEIYFTGEAQVSVTCNLNLSTVLRTS